MYIEAVKRCGSIKQAARDTGIPFSTFHDRLQKERGGGGVSQTDPGDRGLDSFRKLYDKDTIVPDKIQKALDSLGDSWRTEEEFIRMVGTRLCDFATYRDRFDEYIVHVENGRKRVWAGTKSFAAKLRRHI